MLTLLLFDNGGSQMMGYIKGAVVIIVAIFGYTLGRDLAHKTMTPAA